MEASRMTTPTSTSTIPPTIPPTTAAAANDFPVRKRIAVIGANAVGKTALCIRCTYDRFERNHYPTFEDMYRWRTTMDGIDYDVTLVDTNGLDQYSLLGLHYTIGVDGYILAFSLNDIQSLHLIEIINNRLLTTLNALITHGTTEIPRILVGNQADISHPQHYHNHSTNNTSRMAQSFANKIGIPYMETSAYSGQNIPNVFQAILRIVEYNLQASHTMPLFVNRHSSPPSAISNSRSITAHHSKRSTRGLDSDKVIIGEDDVNPTKSCRVQ